MLKETIEIVGPGGVGLVERKRKTSATGSSSTSSPPPVADHSPSVDNEGERAGIRQRLAAVISTPGHS